MLPLFDWSKRSEKFGNFRALFDWSKRSERFGNFRHLPNRPENRINLTVNYKKKWRRS